jgi:hypothetical protein
VKLEFSGQIFEIYSNINFMKIRPVGAIFLHSDGQIGMAKLIVAVRNFAKAPNNDGKATVT